MKNIVGIDYYESYHDKENRLTNFDMKMSNLKSNYGMDITIEKFKIIIF